MDEESVPRDQAWFIDQIQQHQARIRASIRALGVRTAAVDDFAQEALLLAWQKLTDFQSGCDFGAWVTQIARRLIANERRKDARRSRLLAGEVTDLLLLLKEEAGKVTTGIEETEEFAVLQSCLEKLPAHGREIVRLRYFENQSPGAIASQLGRQSSAVRQLLLRLRRVLLECLKTQRGTETG